MRLRPERARGRRGLLPAVLGGGVALVTGLVCGALLFGANNPDRSPPRPPDTGDDRPPAGPPTAGPSAAGAPQPPAAEPGEPEPLPADVTFVEVAGVRLPASASTGPRETRGGLAHGFTRDQAGVTLAAGHILVRVHPEVGAEVFNPTLAAQVVGPHTDALAANAQHGYEQLLNRWPVVYGQPAGNLNFTVQGYRLDAYTDNDATVQLLLDVPDGDGSLLGATSLQMRWHHGDWALVAPVDGAFTATSLVQDTTGFNLWPRETP